MDKLVLQTQIIKNSYIHADERMYHRISLKIAFAE